MNEFFDKIYCINLSSDKKRWDDMLTVFEYLGIDVHRWEAHTPGLFHRYSDVIKNPDMSHSYLACLSSHLSIMEHAISNNYDKILILEDDIVPMKNSHHLLSGVYDYISEYGGFDLLNLAYIRTDDDKRIWTYKNMDVDILSNNIVKSKNFWSCMAYGINRKLMIDTLEWYKNNEPIEIDRYFVKHVQSNDKYNSIGSLPQIFAGTDVVSNNTGRVEGIFNRSTNSRYQSKDDFFFPSDVMNTISPDDYFESVMVLYDSTHDSDSIASIVDRLNSIGISKNISFHEYINDPDQDVVYKSQQDINYTAKDHFYKELTVSGILASIANLENEGTKHLIIDMENIVFNDEFTNMFRKSVKYSPHYDVWKLGAYQSEWISDDINYHFYESYYSLGMFAYSITKEGAIKIYEALKDDQSMRSFDLMVRDIEGLKIINSTDPLIAKTKYREDGDLNDFFDFSQFE